MTNSIVTFFAVFLFSFFQGIDCVSTIRKYEPNRVVNLNSDDLINGYDVEFENRFEFTCISSNGKEVTDKFYIVDSKSINGIRITLKEQHYADKDIFKFGVNILFYHNNFFLVENAKRKIVKINYKGNVTPCDSIYKIIYQSEDENFELLTDDKVSEVELFNELTRGKIKKYVNSLNLVEKNNLQECESLIRILDEEKESEKAGFETKKYRIRESMKGYLDFLSTLIQAKLRQVQHKYSEFEIKIVGYSDERSYGEANRVDYLSFGYPVNENWKIFHNEQNCSSKDLIFYSLTGIYNDQNILRIIDSNCSLGTIRAFSALLYLRKKISANEISDKIIYSYSSGGESRGKDHSSHRKIKVYLSFKGIGRN